MNIGDILMRWSDDTLKSTYHRVRVPEKVRSYVSCQLLQIGLGDLYLLVRRADRPLAVEYRSCLISCGCASMHGCLCAPHPDGTGVLVGWQRRM